MWVDVEDFCSSFKPVQAYGHRCGGKPLNGPQPLLIVALVWSKQLGWKGTRWCTLVKDVLDATSVENISFQLASYIKTFQLGLHVVSIINHPTTLYTWAFLLCGVTIWASLHCGKAWGPSRLWFCLIVFRNLFNVCIGKAFAQYGL